MSKRSFRTELKPKPSPLLVGLKDRVFTIGSCFSDAIGQRLANHKFDTLVNPFGTVYNPVSIFNLLSDSAIDKAKVVERHGHFFHFDFHSSLSAKSKAELLSEIDRIKENALKNLANTNILIVTFGTAWVYEHINFESIVANCHKVPQREFRKRLLGMKEMVEAIDAFIGKLKIVNPKIQLLLTVSPVRHIKDGLVDNHLSKSMLRVLCDFVTSSYDHDHYFPSYEIMIDDLRDYRYYKDDLIHPTPFAEDYIWDIFCETHMDSATRTFVHKWEQIRSAMAHRPFNPDSQNHQKFIRDQLNKLDQLSAQVDVGDEISFFREQIM